MPNQSDFDDWKPSDEERYKRLSRQAWLLAAVFVALLILGYFFFRTLLPPLP